MVADPGLGPRSVLVATKHPSSAAFSQVNDCFHGQAP
jgi:hypothetical protein